VYRALVELRIEIRELKEQIAQLAKGASPVRVTSRRLLESGESDLMMMREEDPPFIEEVPYEIETDDEGNGTSRESTERPLTLPDGQPLPTLEDAERHLIEEALKRFGGNRRQTARALGISERTLYRKLKEAEEEEESSS
jgi:DNA-binding NtrC family response regulator